MLLPVFGSNWSAVGDGRRVGLGVGLSTRAVSASVCGAPAVTVPTIQTPARRDVGALAGCGRHEGQARRAAGRRPARRWRRRGRCWSAVTVKVICRRRWASALLTVLVSGQVGLLRRLGGAGRVVGRVRVELVGGADRRRVGLRRWGCPPWRRSSSVCGRPGLTVPTVHTPGDGVVGALARRRPRRRSARRATGRSPSTSVAVSGPVLVSVTVKVICVADVGRRVAHRLRERQVGLLRRLGGAGAVVGRVRVELVGVR